MQSAQFARRTPSFARPAGQVSVTGTVNGQGQLVDANGNLLTDANGNPIIPAPPVPVVANPPVVTAAPPGTILPSVPQGVQYVNAQGQPVDAYGNPIQSTGSMLLHLALSALFIGGVAYVGSYYGARQSIRRTARSATRRSQSVPLEAIG